MANKIDEVRCVLLPNQKRQIITAIVDAGLDPGDFEWFETASEYRGEKETALVVKHRNKGYYFSVDRAQNDSWLIEYCPASETEWTKRSNGYWSNSVDSAKRWATRVSIELEDEDYVDLATRSPQLLGLPRDESESQVLSTQERELLIQRLDQIETYVLSLRQGSDEFERQVRSSLQFLKHHAKQSDRRSFYALVFSTMLSIGLTFLTPAETKQVIQHATTTLNIELKQNVKVMTVVHNR